MRQIVGRSLVIPVIFSLFAVAASAATLTLHPSSLSIDVGQVLTIDIMASEVSSDDPISAYNIGTQFDPGLLGDLTEDTGTLDVFAGALGLPGTQTSAIWGVFEDINPDLVITKEVAGGNLVLTKAQLAERQGGEFRLATLFFLANSPGTAIVRLATADLRAYGPGDPPTGSTLAVTLGDALSISIVPVPAAIWLLGSALGVLGWLRRRVS